MSIQDNIKNNVSFLYSVLPASLIESSKERAIGPDLSRWKEFYNPDLATNKADFAITKATEGMTWIDSKLKEIWSGVEKLDIRGLFHYQRSGMSWKAQVEHFLSVSQDYDAHILALDVEGVNNSLNDEFFQDSYRILKHLNANSSKKIMLYTNPNLFQNFLYPKWVQYFGSEGKEYALTVALWIAQYWWVRSPDKEPGMPNQRFTWDIWQWTDRANPEEWGAGSLSLDLNVFNGTVKDMRVWLGLPESTPEPEEPPIVVVPETETPIEPVTEEEIWQAKVVASSKVHVRTFPKVDITTKTGYYVETGQIFRGKLWVGNGYVWIKIVDNVAPINGRWVAVRSEDGSIKLLSLTKTNPATPTTSTVTRWRVKHDIEIGSIWRAGLPEVHPLFVDPDVKSGTHFSPFQKWAQLLSLAINPNFPIEYWDKIYWFNYWIANRQGYGMVESPRANFVNNKNVDKELPRVESLTTGGSLIEGERMGDWVRVKGIPYNSPVSLDFLKSNPQFWTRAVYAGGTGQPFRMLGHRYQGPTLIHPLIISNSYGLYIQVSKLQEWTTSDVPDPLKIYL